MNQYNLFSSTTIESMDLCFLQHNQYTTSSNKNRRINTNYNGWWINLRLLHRPLPHQHWVSSKLPLLPVTPRALSPNVPCLPLSGSITIIHRWVLGWFKLLKECIGTNINTSQCAATCRASLSIYSLYDISICSYILALCLNLKHKQVKISGITVPTAML